MTTSFKRGLASSAIHQQLLYQSSQTNKASRGSLLVEKGGEQPQGPGGQLLLLLLLLRLSGPHPTLSTPQLPHRLAALTSPTLMLNQPVLSPAPTTPCSPAPDSCACPPFYSTASSFFVDKLPSLSSCSSAGVRPFHSTASSLRGL